MKLPITSDCLQITGPNDEICTPVSEAVCKKKYTCDGKTAVQNSSYVKTTNGCGPNNFPTGPSFSFGKCCESHDFCYPTCLKPKAVCDFEFYQCMACSCYGSYDNAFTEEFCLLIACLYYQGVDHFGCSAYAASQGRACECPAKSAEVSSTNNTLEITDKHGKFGPAFKEVIETYKTSYDRGIVNLICEPPQIIKISDCPSNTTRGEGATFSASLIFTFILCLLVFLL